MRYAIDDAVSARSRVKHEGAGVPIRYVNEYTAASAIGRRTAVGSHEVK